MIIAIAGLSSSGKNTLGKRIAERLRYKLICPTFKDLAKRDGITLMEFQKKARTDQGIDKKFDAELKKQAAEAGNCVATTWLSAWMLDADVRIAVIAPFDVRAKRLAERDKMSLKEAKKHTRERDKDNIDRYLRLYRINITDYSGFDACLSSATFNPEQLFELAMAVIEKKGNI